MLLKAGASIDGIKPELLFGLYALGKILEGYSESFIITEVTGGVHKDGSLHYRGLAADIRSQHIKSSVVKEAILEEVQRALDSRFDFILEDVGTHNEHFHLEYDPKDKETVIV